MENFFLKEVIPPPIDIYRGGTKRGIIGRVCVYVVKPSAGIYNMNEGLIEKKNYVI